MRHRARVRSAFLFLLRPASGLKNDERDGPLKFHQAAATLILAALVLVTFADPAFAQGDAVRVGIYRVTLQRDAEHLVVREAYSFENGSDATITPPGGSLLFDLPHDIHGEIGVTVLSGGQRSEGQLVQDSTDSAIHGLELQLPPGRTTVTLSYNFHYGEETAFQPRFFYPMDRGQIFVQPADMHVHGSVTQDASSPMQGFASWTLTPLTQPGQLDITLSGGSAAGTTQQAPSMQRPSTQEEWRVSVQANRFARDQAPILIGLFLATTLGLGLLYGINSGRGAAQENAAQLKLTLEITRLEDRFVSGQIQREEFLKQRDRVLQSADGKSGKGSRKRQPVG